MARKPKAKLLVIGYGFRGRQWQQEIERHSDFAVTGVVDPDPAASAEAAKAGFATFARIPEALDHGPVEAAIIASPSSMHVSDVLQCLHGGVGVLVEKPMALSLRDAMEMVASGTELALPVFAVQNFRLRARERTLRRALQEGVIGRPHVSFVTSARPPDTAPEHARSLDDYFLWDLGIHHLDSLRVRFGMPGTLSCKLRSTAGGRVWSVALSYESGLDVSYNHSEGPPLFYYHEWIEGEKGALAAVDETVYVYLPSRRRRRLRPSRAPRPEQAILDELAQALAGSVVDSSFEARNNVGTIALVEAAATSLRSERPVSMDDVMKVAHAEGQASGKSEVSD